MLCDSNDYIEKFDIRHCRNILDGFCHIKCKTFVSYLLITPNNDRHFIEFENRLHKDLLKKYKIALSEYLRFREVDIWKKAHYLRDNGNFKKLCEFFCSKEERKWRRDNTGPYPYCCKIPF